MLKRSEKNTGISEQKIYELKKEVFQDKIKEQIDLVLSKYGELTKLLNSQVIAMGNKILQQLKMNSQFPKIRQTIDRFDVYRFLKNYPFYKKRIVPKSKLEQELMKELHWQIIENPKIFSSYEIFKKQCYQLLQDLGYIELYGIKPLNLENRRSLRYCKYKLEKHLKKLNSSILSLTSQEDEKARIRQFDLIFKEIDDISSINSTIKEPQISKKLKVQKETVPCRPGVTTLDMNKQEIQILYNSRKSFSYNTRKKLQNPKSSPFYNNNEYIIQKYLGFRKAQKDKKQLKQFLKTEILDVGFGQIRQQLEVIRYYQSQYEKDK